MGSLDLALLVPKDGDDVKYHLERPNHARRTLCGRKATNAWSTTWEQLGDIPRANRTYGIFCVTCLDASRRLSDRHEDEGSDG